MIKDGKGKRSCLLDGEKGSVNSKTIVYSWGMEKSEGSQHSLEASSCGEFISVCSVWEIVHLPKLYSGTQAEDNQCLCDLCDQDLISRNYQKKHMKIHTKENLYKCALCGKGFISRNHLKRNMKGHAIHIHVLCVSRNSSPSTTKIDALTVILGTSISLFCLISKNTVVFFLQLAPTNSALLALSADKKHHGNTLLHKIGNAQLFTAGETCIKLFG